MAKQEVRFKMDRKYLDNLKELSGITSSNQVMQEAVSLYSWALKKKSEGYDIVTASDEPDKNQEKVVMPGLVNAEHLSDG
ncbi:MAG: hypothetical protein AAF149_08520 [Bacteroidota bacterium]